MFWNSRHLVARFPVRSEDKEASAKVFFIFAGLLKPNQ